MEISKKIGMAILTLGLLLGASPLLAQDTIQIAMFDQLSGPFKYAGDSIKMGLEFLAEEINESGGLLGKKVEIIADDGQFRPDVSVRKAQKRVMEGVKFIASGTAGHAAIALADLAAKEKVIYINYGSLVLDLTGKFCNPYSFRTAHHAEMSSLAMADFLATKPYRKFYLINQDYAMGHDVSKSFMAAVKRVLPDAQFVGQDFHPMATKDFGPYVSKILAAKPDLIFTANFMGDLINLMKQGKAMGLKAPLMTFYLNDPNLLRSLGDEAIGSFVCESYMETVRTAANKDLLQRWNKKPKYRDFDKTPWCIIGKAYYGMKFFTEAVKKAGTLDVPTIIRTWEGMKWDSPIGPMAMRAEDHQASLPMFVSEFIPTNNEFYPFPYVGEVHTVPPEKTTIPLNETGCKRKKGEM
jgi:branched-chain amino acid transport system substrate-binding protein